MIRRVQRLLVFLAHYQVLPSWTVDLAHPVTIANRLVYALRIL